MDFLSTTGREYNTQTGAHFTIRSANSLSYNEAWRTSRYKREEKESRDRPGTKTESSLHYQPRICSGVKGQSLESDKTPIKQNQSSLQDDSSKYDQTGKSERRGRTEWRRNYLSSRSKSLDWGTRTKSPERSWNYREDILGRTGDRRAEGSKVMSTVYAYNTVNKTNDQDFTLSKAKGQSLPSRYTSTSLGPKGGQSILERIEKLYGSMVCGNTEDYKTTESFCKSIRYEVSKFKRVPDKEFQNARDPKGFNEYSKTILDLSNTKVSPPIMDFNFDETDFGKVVNPLKLRDINTSSGSDISTPTSSDSDETPTNTPGTSPHLSPTAPPQKTPPLTLNKSSLDSSTPLTSNLPDLVSKDDLNGKKRILDLNAWLDGLNPQIKAWEDNKEEDDDSTQKDEDSNYDSDSGESSVTVTSAMSNKSFSVSLADLCNFAGVDYESENDTDEWQPAGRRSASLSSDISAFSHVSVLPTEELDKLIEDVKSIGDDNLQDYEDVHVVVLHKEIGVGLGFSLAGGVDQNKPVTVHKVFHSGVAAQEGSIKEGDQVLSINGSALSGFAHWEALRVLRRAKSREMGVVVLKKPDMRALSDESTLAMTQGPTPAQVNETSQYITVSLEKTDRDLGFSLEGGVDSSLGNKPLTVQKVFQGGPVEKVLPGDEVLEVNGVSVVGLRRLEAWTLIRKLSPGPVSVVLRRRPQLQNP
uniref:PDZ domain-containing protein n=1 Tax=Periophthalmus magnuspinnatus TaxID=409849 RepID=A0A3B4A1M4_9GOBI